MDKKTEITSFRTTEDNLTYLKKLGESDERSISYVINRMIEHFKKFDSQIKSLLQQSLKDI